MAHPRHGTREGIERVGQNGVVGEAMHEVLETIDKVGFHILLFCHRNIEPIVSPMSSLFSVPVKIVRRSGGLLQHPLGGWKSRLMSLRRRLGPTKTFRRDIVGAAERCVPDTLVSRLRPTMLNGEWPGAATRQVKAAAPDRAFAVKWIRRKGVLRPPEAGPYRGGSNPRNRLSGRDKG